MHGALLIDKPAGPSSFGVIETLQRELMRFQGSRKRDLPKLGHGGTLDPFATGLLVVCVGHGVKLSRYFLGSNKTYEGVIRFGETTVPGDPTEDVSERSSQLPRTLEEIQTVATGLTLQGYLQVPPMHSAKKRAGKPLYELARQGIEVEREPKLCQLHSFQILDYEAPRARFRVECSSGTYIRTLAQDLGRLLGSVAMLDSLRRTASGAFQTTAAVSVEDLCLGIRAGESWDQLPAWVSFHRLLDGQKGMARAEATLEECRALSRGRQGVLVDIVGRRAEPSGRSLGNASEEGVAIYGEGRLWAVASRQGQGGQWGLDRVFSID